MEFIINNLEVIVSVTGGLLIGSIMFLFRFKGRDNDLTALYIKHKKHNERINKSTKTAF